MEFQLKIKLEILEINISFLKTNQMHDVLFILNQIDHVQHFLLHVISGKCKYIF